MTVQKRLLAILPRREAMTAGESGTSGLALAVAMAAWVGERGLWTFWVR